MRQEDRMMAAVGCVDWELVEGAAAPAGRRRLPRRARVGLIAACLCLVLAGTVWALEAVLGCGWDRPGPAMTIPDIQCRGSFSSST